MSARSWQAGGNQATYGQEYIMLTMDDVGEFVGALPLELGDLIVFRHLDDSREYARFVAGYGEDVLVTRVDMSECFFPCGLIDVAATVAALEG